MRKLSKYSDFELMELLSGKKSDFEAAFAEIYSRYSQSLYAYCQRVMDFSEEADDVFQETLIKFIETYKTTKNVNNIKGILIVIARNHSLNYKRTVKESVEIDEIMLVSEENKDLEHEELLNLLDNAIKLLEYDYREVFVLRNYNGLSYNEISEILGINLTTVRNRLFRAKEKIKELLQPFLAEL
jgi:RNA polymerase sigma-70 factor, ECF subfamily